MAVLVTGEKLEILITEAEIASRINTLAQQISTAYEQTNQLVVIGLLRGSFVFIADLVRCLDLPVEVDFMTVSSYGNKMKSSGQLRIIKDVETDLKNRDILIIEDIIDTGHTLSQVISLLVSKSDISVLISESFSDGKSRDKRSHARIRFGIALLAESIPISFIPLSKNGITVAGSEESPAFPIAATAVSCFI